MERKHFIHSPVPVIIMFFAFLLMAFFVQSEKIEQFDLNIIHFIQGLEGPLLTGVMKFFTQIGSVPFVIILSVLISLFLYFALHHRSEMILLIVVIVGTQVINYLLKQYFARMRPDLHRLIEISGYSFPSGHAMTAFSFYTLLAFLLWRHIRKRIDRIILVILSACFIILIGISRIYLGVHYPSDIIGGYFVSATWCLLAIRVFQKYKDRNNVSRMK